MSMSLSPSSPETLVGHLPIEIACLLTYFLEASPENKLNAIVIGKRKREVGLVVPAKYAALTKNKTFANVLAGKLQEKKRKHPNFEFEITTTTVTKVLTNVKCKKMSNNHNCEINIKSDRNST